jgi:hypothetical protein
MIEQCLSNKNESATVLFSKSFCELNKALVYNWIIFIKFKQKCYNVKMQKDFVSKQDLSSSDVGHIIVIQKLFY